MHARTWKIAAVVGVLAGFVVSAAMTLVDWWRNPANLFHSDSGTNWTAVAETAISWAWPVAIATFLATAIVRYLKNWIGGR